MEALTVVGLTGGCTTGVADGGMQRLDRRYTERAHVGVGLECAVGPRGGRAEGRGPEQLGGRGGGGGEAPEIGGAGAPAAAGCTTEAVRPHHHPLGPQHDHPSAAVSLTRRP